MRVLVVGEQAENFKRMFARIRPDWDVVELQRPDVSASSLDAVTDHLDGDILIVADEPPLTLHLAVRKRVHAIPIFVYTSNYIDSVIQTLRRNSIFPFCVPTSLVDIISIIEEQTPLLQDELRQHNRQQLAQQRADALLQQHLV